VLGGRELADQAVDQLFDLLPKPVAEALAPQVDAIMGSSRIDLLTLSAGVALFFATSAIETLRAALNGAYRAVETRAYPVCLLISMAFVLVSAVSMLVLTWGLVVGPAIAARLEPGWLAKLDLTWLAWIKSFLFSSWFATWARYAAAAVVIAVQLFAMHVWLAAGRRRFVDVWPGVMLSVVLWLLLAALYSYYLDFSDYTRFYAGLSQLMVALIFFQVTAVIVILGAELNRGIIELTKGA
jgi:membrane protein